MTTSKPDTNTTQAQTAQSGCGCGKPKLAKPTQVKPDEILPGPTDLFKN